MDRVPHVAPTVSVTMDVNEKGAWTPPADETPAWDQERGPHRRGPRRGVSWRTCVVGLFVAGMLLWQCMSTMMPRRTRPCHAKNVDKAAADRLYYALRGPLAKAEALCQIRGGDTSSSKCYPSLDERNAALETAFLAVPQAESIRDALQRYTSHVHRAGDEGDQASVVQLLNEWSELLGAPAVDDASTLIYEAGSAESRAAMERRDDLWRDDATVTPRVWADTYSVLLDEPGEARLSVTEAERPTALWNATLTEDVLSDDPTSAHGLPPFHGYSAPGSASAPLVYAGTGSHEDFARLLELGIPVEGRIVLVRYGGAFRGLKVRAAQEYGAVGVLIYSDPAEDGEVTAAKGYEAYPHGPARQPSSIQRGSVQALSFYPGDPTTPGTPSYRNATRLPREKADNLPRIPSLPLSYANAQKLLAYLRGHGHRASDVRDHFAGALPDTEYWTGPSEVVVHMTNDIHPRQKDIWNVYAVIPGYLDDQRVMLGNHRDAWVFGAGDPSSGTAVFHDVLKGLGELYKSGWRPMRTLMFASWDAEEYGLVGSTEFGEDFSSFVQANVAMYHNLDMAVSGTRLQASASPSLAALLRRVVKATPRHTNHTLELSHVGSLGSGSDYTVFLQHLGVPSTDLSFKRGPRDPVYHYHSNYDSFAWMDQYGDPGFTYHVTMAQAFGLLALRSVDAPFLPIEAMDYAKALHTYHADALQAATSSGVDVPKAAFQALHRAVNDVHQAAMSLQYRQTALAGHIRHILRHAHHKPSRRVRRLMYIAHHLNRQLQTFEQRFLDRAGLRDRPWYRHLGVAPGRWLGYGSTTFPGVTESFTLDRGHNSEHELARLTHALHAVAQSLRW